MELSLPVRISFLWISGGPFTHELTHPNKHAIKISIVLLLTSLLSLVTRDLFSSNSSLMSDKISCLSSLQQNNNHQQESKKCLCLFTTVFFLDQTKNHANFPVFQIVTIYIVSCTGFCRGDLQVLPKPADLGFAVCQFHHQVVLLWACGGRDRDWGSLYTTL